MRSTIQYIENELAGLYPSTEISGFVRLILESVYQLSYTGQVLMKAEKLPEEGFERVQEIVARLKMYEPLQYILGETWFHDLRLNVAPGVLIPRPETEELVDRILQLTLDPAARILDIGTGSGAIALALKKGFPDAGMEAVDISEKALEIARENAKRHQLDVHFSQCDILKWKDHEWPQYDLIVSNPPYVRESEKKQMEANVLRYEPTTALFVDDADPLLFYRAIAAFAGEHLKKEGYLFFEINESLGSEMKQLLETAGFEQVQLWQDINGRNRMAGCQK